ncbi:MAG: ketoacyl-ACP synthase III [Chitinophagales bacterium]
MAFLQIKNVAISGIAASVPENTISNSDYPFANERERDLFIKSTGIEQRRIIDQAYTAADLCAQAALKLMKDMQLKHSDIKLLIFVTQTPDYITPATAVKLQHELGLNEDCLAFDINLGCSGYVYGLSVAASLLSNIPNPEAKALLLVGDTSSACISEADKSTAPLFSDAGSATVLNKSEGEHMDFLMSSDGSGYESIIIPDGGYRNPFSESSLEMKEESEGINRNATHLILKGIDIFNFSVKRVPAQINELLNLENKKVEDVNYYVFHQANKLINDTIAKKLKLSRDQAPLSLKKFGNTSSASIPLTMVYCLRDVLSENKTNNLILSGFGVGLSWASVYLKTKKLYCPKLVEV